MPFVSLLLLPMVFQIKRDINKTHLSLHIFTLTTEFNDPQNILTYVNLPDPGSSHGKTLIQTVLFTSPSSP